MATKDRTKKLNTAPPTRQGTPAPGTVSGSPQVDAELARLRQQQEKNRLLIIVGGVALLLMAGIVIGFMLSSRNSVGDPYKADRIAYETAVAAQSQGSFPKPVYPNQVVPQAPITPPLNITATKITPGTYTKPNPNATDGAEVVASFYLFAIQGKVDEAMKLAANPADSNLRARATYLSTNKEAKDFVSTVGGISIKGGFLREAISFDLVREDQTLNRETVYTIEGIALDNLLGIDHCIHWAGNGWQMAKCPR